MTRRRNPLDGWCVARARIGFRGTGLQRPACVLAERDGTLWTSDVRGAVRLRADGTQELVYQYASEDPTLHAGPLNFGGSLPNGIALDGHGRLVIANIGASAIESMARDGQSGTLLDAIDGRPLGRPISVLRDRAGRLWFSATRSLSPWIYSIRERSGDGYVAVIDERGARIVADGLSGVGELSFDVGEQWLHVAEPRARRILRLHIDAQASCIGREVFGPADLGGIPSGLAMDAFGNLWVTLVMAERLVALTPQGDLRVLLDDGDAHALHAFERHLGDDTLTPEVMAACQGALAPWMGGIAFGGPALSTVYLGSLAGSSLPFFDAPGPGLALPHWGA